MTKVYSTPVTDPNMIHFVDWETVPIKKDFNLLTEDEAYFFKKMHNYIYDRAIREINQVGGRYEDNEVWGTIYEENASFMAEFSKIVSASIGKVGRQDGELYFFVKTIASRDEAMILRQIKMFLDGNAKLSPSEALCAHNGREFDYPFANRRFIINGIEPPAILNFVGKKPWDITDKLLDTKELWKGTQYNHKVSLDFLCFLLGINSPKGDMDGLKVASVYHSMFDDVPKGDLPFDKEKEVLDRIATYNTGDVIADYKVYCKIKGVEPLSDDKIRIV